MNAAHPDGGPKSRIISAATGLTTIKQYEKGKPSVAMDAASQNPIHMGERERILFKIEKEAKGGASAERRETNPFRARMDTKHVIDGPSGSKTIRAQWVYPTNTTTKAQSAAPHLGTIQPSDTSSEEEEGKSHGKNSKK